MELGNASSSGSTLNGSYAERNPIRNHYVPESINLNETQSDKSDFNTMYGVYEPENDRSKSMPRNKPTYAGQKIRSSKSAVIVGSIKNGCNIGMHKVGSMKVNEPNVPDDDEEHLYNECAFEDAVHIYSSEMTKKRNSEDQSSTTYDEGVLKSRSNCSETSSKRKKKAVHGQYYLAKPANSSARPPYNYEKQQPIILDVGGPSAMKGTVPNGMGRRDDQMRVEQDAVSRKRSKGSKSRGDIETNKKALPFVERCEDGIPRSPTAADYKSLDTDEEIYENFDFELSGEIIEIPRCGSIEEKLTMALELRREQSRRNGTKGRKNIEPRRETESNIGLRVPSNAMRCKYPNKEKHGEKRQFLEKFDDCPLYANYSPS